MLSDGSMGFCFLCNRASGSVTRNYNRDYKSKGTNTPQQNKPVLTSKYYYSNTKAIVLNIFAFFKIITNFAVESYNFIV